MTPSDWTENEKRKGTSMADVTKEMNVREFAEVADAGELNANTVEMGVYQFIDKFVKEEREACALIAERWGNDDAADAIRARASK